LGNIGGSANIILDNLGTTVFRHNTIYGNTGTGGIGFLAPNGAVRLIATGAGVLTMEHTISAGNSSEDINAAYSGSNNLIGGAPLLAPLGDYGGPTPTMALLPGSPAIDGATGSTATNDQRGVARPYGAAPDIGAYEAGTFSNFNAWIWESLTNALADHSAGADVDGDFVTNGDEWNALTNPDDGNNFLSAWSISNTDLLFPSVLNRTYRLQQADAVAGPWTNSVAAPIAGDGTVKAFALPSAPAEQYFRVEAGP
jgi:hypothetical protein